MVKHLPQPEAKSPPAINPAAEQESATRESKDPTEGAIVPTKNSNGRVDQFFSLPDRFPVQIFNEETGLQKAGHWGPIVMGLASIVLSFVVYLNTKELQNTQVRLTGASRRRIS